MGASLLQYLTLEKAMRDAVKPLAPQDALQVYPRVESPVTPLSKALYKAIEPLPYPNKEKLQEGALNTLRVLMGREVKTPIDGNSARPEIIEHIKKKPEDFPMDASQEDGWRKFLGLPQIANSFEESLYKPSLAKDSGAKYFKANRGWRDILQFYGGVEGALKFLDINKTDKKVTGGPFYLANFTLSRGKDEKGHFLSYYDKYDFDVPGSNMLGKPFEIYDRIYYDPKTFKPIKQETRPELDAKKLQKLIPGLFGTK